jgi:hypothetical protein
MIKQAGHTHIHYITVFAIAPYSFGGKMVLRRIRTVLPLLTITGTKAEEQKRNKQENRTVFLHKSIFSKIPVGYHHQQRRCAILMKK